MCLLHIFETEQKFHSSQKPTKMDLWIFGKTNKLVGLAKFGVVSSGGFFKQDSHFFLPFPSPLP